VLGDTAAGSALMLGGAAAGLCSQEGVVAFMPGAAQAMAACTRGGVATVLGDTAAASAPILGDVAAGLCSQKGVVAAVSAASAGFAEAGPVAVADSASTFAARAAVRAGAAAVGCGHALCAARLGSTRQQGSRVLARRRGRRAKRSTQLYCGCARELYALRDASWGRQPAVRLAWRIVGAPASRASTSALRLRTDNS